MKYLFAFIIGLLVLIPNLLATQNDLYQGIPVSLNSDEYSYFSHTQEALLGRFGQAGKGITLSSVDEPSFHLAPIEEFYGILFGWTGVQAATLFVWLDFIIPFLLFLVVFALARVLKFSEKESLIIAGIFCLAQLYSLGRPVNPRASTLVQLGALAGLLSQNKKLQLLGAVMMGVLVGTNVWAWTALWCYWVLYLLYLVVMKDDRRKLLFFNFQLSILAAAPFVWHMFSIASHPAHPTASASAGLIHYRFPESWVWSVLTVLLAGAMCTLWMNRGKKKEEATILLFPITAFIILNQQLVHGMVLQFRSHYAPFILLAACISVMFAYRNRRQVSGTVLLIASVLLIGLNVYDNRYILGQWKQSDTKFANQHLAGAIPVLDAHPRSVILSDSETSNFLAAFTKHDVLFTPYLQHTLVDNEQLAIYYCMTQLPSTDTEEELSDEFTKHLLAINSQFEPFLRMALKNAYNELVTEICEEMKNGDHKGYLNALQVSYIFWNEKARPNWNLDQVQAKLFMQSRGKDWSLWSVE